VTFYLPVATRRKKEPAMTHLTLTTQLSVEITAYMVVGYEKDETTPSHVWGPLFANLDCGDPRDDVAWIKERYADDYERFEVYAVVAVPDDHYDGATAVRSDLGYWSDRREELLAYSGKRN
jgi:hypothetical protein